MRNKMMIKTTLFLLPVFFLLSGCSKNARGGMAYGEADSAAASLGEGELSGSGLDSGQAPLEMLRGGNTAGDEAGPSQASQNESLQGAEKSRKLIKTVRIEIRADKSLLDEEGKFFGASKKLDELIDTYGAYSEQSVIYENSLDYTIRVPQDSLEAMLAGLSGLGKVVSRVETARDVTLSYYDLSGRLATKQALLQTFRSYLAKAQTMEEILSVETKTAELQNEIDWLGTELAELSNLVDYATIHLNIYSPQTSSTSTYTLGDRIAELFESFGDFASGALVVILGLIIFGGPLIVAFLAAFWLLFGKIGLLKKAFHLVAGNSPRKPAWHRHRIRRK